MHRRSPKMRRFLRALRREEEAQNFWRAQRWIGKLTHEYQMQCAMRNAVRRLHRAVAF